MARNWPWAQRFYLLLIELSECHDRIIISMIKDHDKTYIMYPCGLPHQYIEKAITAKKYGILSLHQ